MSEARSDSAALLRRDRRRARLRTHSAAYAFLLPNLVVFVAFLLVPIGWLIRQSLFEGGVLGPEQWVGLANWDEVLTAGSPGLESLKNTAVYTALAVPVMLALALVVALALREISRGGTIARFVIFFPSLTPFLLAALIWSFIVHPDFGLLNVAPRALGGDPINWLGDPQLALPTLAMLEVWRGFGFWALFFLAGMLAVPRDLYEAASLDGASAVRRFIHVTLPGLGPALVIAAVLATIFALQVFEGPFALTQGGPAGSTETAVFYMYQTIFEQAKPGVGAAVSILMLFAIALLTATALYFQGRSGRSARTRAEAR